ncbi:putative type VI secretion system effector [Stenotrophomonas rhizophila]|uniref:putative type VI secretion system effector n=1 Tax=Stenotrophomonas rhizophila TaxID=216778 RepID=UPI001E5C78F3|nr:putative type VI secretion system effector [Stenotrophomonas rhizophila]MCC7634004.1 hypothetical protein [Stenotrophomonas rhizophila]MCC7663338.1 hypothetical protein [Stenotrophomonas rhizophila]
MTKPSRELRRIDGEIRGLRRSRQSFDLSEQIPENLAASVMAAGLAGMEASAVAMATLDATEQVDHVEFHCGDEPVQGVFWRFPFNDGDHLELAVERGANGWLAYGARRKTDGLVAVYPHSFEGRRAHFASTFRFWGIVLALIFLLMMVLDTIFAIARGTFGIADQLAAYGTYATYLLPALIVVFGFLAWRAGQKTVVSADIAERIFRGFGWRNPRWINLRKTSKALRKGGEGRDYGLRYFRY